jgi:hypothetical protein
LGGSAGWGGGRWGNRTYHFECFLNDELPFKGIPFKGIGTWATMKVFFGGKRDEVGKYIRKNKAEFYQ